MNSRITLAGICLLAAFGLAACGGGGGTTATAPTETPVMMPDGGMDGDGDTTEPTVPSAADLFAAAQDARDASAAAATAAGDAVKAAMENMDKFSTMAANGDSMMAEANAQAVLTAQADAVQAVTDAEAALQSAKDALEDAMEHAADNASLNSALEAAIKAAEADVKTATDARDGDDLKAAVAAVQNPDGDDPAPDPLKTPADHGQDVAMAIGTALGPTSETDGSGMSVTHTDNPTIPEMGAVQMNNHQGKTWAEIADNVMTVRIANVQTKVASIAGMTGTDVHADLVGGYADPDEGDSVTGSTYKGISGTAYCLGADCKVSAEGDLTGSWYFAPTSPMVYYEKVGDATVYTAETNYARFGHWLVVDGNGAATVNTYADGGVTDTVTTGLNVTTVNTAADATMLTDTEATYTGTAAGMSLHKEVDALGDPVKGSLSSGAFTAIVTLTAKFGVDPKLGGTIDGFASVNGGNNVDPGWTVELTETDFDGATVAATNGVANASGQDGEWSATGYGTTGQRPAGIYGGFSAHFTDGHASGAYATRK